MRKLSGVLIGIFLLSLPATAQVSSVMFGKNRVQYKNFKWRFYQTRNFNTYFSQGGLALGKFVAQVAEQELPGLEEFVEYSLQRRGNIIVYNSFTDYKQSNIGLGIDWQQTGGVTRLVNNKVLVYYDGNLNNLARQVREGIAKILVDNLLFGDDLGEFAGNQALLDLPKWLTDGYVAYAGENWSPALDDKLKSALLSGNYRTFYQFAFREPDLAGHAFWHFVEENYKKDNTTYFLYLSRIYKSTNSASLRVTKMKFKDLLAQFMEKESERYQNDLRGRRNQPKGNVVALEEVNTRKDYYRFQANPIPRNNTYAMVEFKKGIYKVLLENPAENRKTLLKSGTMNYQAEVNPNYPILAWDPKGSRLLCIYTEEGKIKMFVYDLVAKMKRNKQEIADFQLIQDAKYMLDNNTLVLSGVKNGQSDIFTYKINEQTAQQITNDPYDDIDPSFVAFPNKTGIIFSSNRPYGDAPKGDTVIPSKNRFNVFLVDNWNRSEFRQISKLSDMKYGNGRYPLQYNSNHFTFVSEENGISNRYAGFFTTKRAGLDTLVKVGDEMLRNPTPEFLDSTLKAWGKSEPDSVGFMSITNDSAYVFPITNYQSGLLETRGAGDNNLVSEVRREGDLKFLYKLKINEDVLKRRNINARPTDYVKRLMEEDRKKKSQTIFFQTPGKKPGDSTAKSDLFQTEFDNSKDTVLRGIENLGEMLGQPKEEPVLHSAKLYDYKLKFSSEYIVAGFDNSVLVNRYQPYAGGTGPIFLTNSEVFNGIIRMGIADLMEDIKFSGGVRISTNLRDNDYFVSFKNLKHRLDWGMVFYRSNFNNFQIYDPNDIKGQLRNKMFSNLYQIDLSYPIDEIRSFRAHIGYRSDRVTIKSDANYPPTLAMNDTLLRYGMMRLEYVHDNTINPALDIWNGLRFKFYADVLTRLTNGATEGKNTFNLGTDIRYYYPIYRNFIWAVRGAADFSFGTQKLIYYLGGVEGWFSPKFNSANQPAPDRTYTFQTLAVNLRGHNQNVANGNNAIVMNSEFRLPIVSTFFNRPINNAFLRNFQVIQFTDLGTAWNGQFLHDLNRPSVVYGAPPVTVNIKTGGIGPFVGGYGFGARSTLLGYFLRLDAGWPMDGFFRGKPRWYFAMGLDF
jgi:hypothetical protein